MLEAEARSRIEAMVDHSVDPTLSTGEVDDLVTIAKRPDAIGNLPTNVSTSAAAWASATTYAYGDVVKPSPADGRYWRCIVPGQSDTTQPDWPDLAGSLVTNGTIGDGDVTWQDAGSEWTPTWDLEHAAVVGWELKAGKAAARFDFTTDGQTFRRAQIADHCLRMADRYRRRRAVSVQVG